MTLISEQSLDLLKLLAIKFDVPARLASVGVTVRLEANLPRCRLSGKRAPARKQLCELKRLALRDARAVPEREDNVRHSAEANSGRPFHRLESGTVALEPLLAPRCVRTLTWDARNSFVLVRIAGQQGLERLARLGAELEVHHCVRGHSLDHRPSVRPELELNCK
jgi:hypothetical protein